jgi:exopolyphosphatase/guanosine-5'-triphosphate,3'-diphosphate pyrophosphatase
MSAVSIPRNPSREENSSTPVAVVDIGATSIRMAIAEISPGGGVRLLERLNQTIAIGKDTFTTQRIRRSSIEECVRVLRSYRRAMQQYGINRAKNVRVVATSAVREAVNRLAFIDRIFIATGLVVETLDEAEVNRITYMGIQPLLKNDPTLTNTKNIVVEVGSGSTEILVVRNGNVLFSNSYRLGSLRLIEQLERLKTPGTKYRSIMETQIRRFVELMHDQVHGDSKFELVAMGGDIRFAVKNLIGTEEVDMMTDLPVAALARLANEVLDKSGDEAVQKYSISFPDAETVGPALLCYVRLAERFGCTRIHAAPTNLRDGLLSDFANVEKWTAEFRNQIIRSAINLGRKFGFDEKHAKHVAMLSRKLFAELQEEHQLDQRMELILYLAALLYSIGQFINVRSNHKHAMYLIRNSEMFGLSRKDVLLVALVARYHRRSSPQSDHEGYATLDRNDRVAVSKLAAILRIAIALDETRSQRIVNFRSRRDSDRWILTTTDVEDLSLEQLMVRQTGNLFEEIFGMSVMLRAIRRNAASQ